MKLSINYEAAMDNKIKYCVKNNEKDCNMNELLYHMRNFLLSAGFLSAENRRLSLIDDDGNELWSSDFE